MSEDWDLPATLGFAHFFENVVVYCPIEHGVQNLFTFLMSKRRRKRAGAYVGSVKALIPYDSYHILMEDLKPRPKIVQRQKLRVWKRKRGITRLMLKRNKRLSDFP